MTPWAESHDFFTKKGTIVPFLEPLIPVNRLLSDVAARDKALMPGWSVKPPFYNHDATGAICRDVGSFIENLRPWPYIYSTNNRKVLLDHI